MEIIVVEYETKKVLATFKLDCNPFVTGEHFSMKIGGKKKLFVVEEVLPELEIINQGDTDDFNYNFVLKVEVSS